MASRWLQGSLPKGALQALPGATLPLHSFLIWLPIRALLVHRRNCWHRLRRHRGEKLKAALLPEYRSVLETGLQTGLSGHSLIYETFLGPPGYTEPPHAFLAFHVYLAQVILICISSSDSSSLTHPTRGECLPCSRMKWELTNIALALLSQSSGGQGQGSRRLQNSMTRSSRNRGGPWELRKASWRMGHVTCNLKGKQELATHRGEGSRAFGVSRLREKRRPAGV